MKILSEEPLTLDKVKEILAERKKAGDLTYEQKVSLEYAKEFGKMNSKKVEEAVNALLNLDIPLEKAIEIVNARPETLEQALLFFEKEKKAKEKAEKVLEIVKDL